MEEGPSKKEMYHQFLIICFLPIPSLPGDRVPTFWVCRIRASGMQANGSESERPLSQGAQLQGRDAAFLFHRYTLIPFALVARNSLNCVSKRSLYSLNSGIDIWYSP